MMQIKLNLSYDAQDDLFMDLLTEGYEAAYYSYTEDMEKYSSDPVRYEFKYEDILRCKQVLIAYEVLADHYTAVGRGQARLRQIRDRYDFGRLIVKGMSSK